ncbi:MAG: transglutaminase-like domain-containing protein [Janthinobacterium lividum]
MHRRHLVGALMASPCLALGRPSHAQEAAPVKEGDGWRQFEVTTRVTLSDAPGPAQLWLPLAQTAAGYQSAGALSWTTGHDTDIVRRVRDERYGAPLLRVDFGGRTTATTDTPGAAAAGTPQGGIPQDAAKTITVVQQVETRTRGALPFASLGMAERRFWTEPMPSAPTDGLVRETAERITAGRTGDRARLRALYDWVVDTTYRRAEIPGCGTGDYVSMLQSGVFGGKCADINGLLVGLARSIGLPARDVYGIRVAASQLAASLGRGGDISRAQHCRAEVFLDDEGWFPVDPADVRKVILEQHLEADSRLVRDLRERLFGHWEMNWIGYNSATDLEFPDSGARRPNFAFLMYPCAFTSAGQPDCLDPAGFRYEITSRELTA